MALSYYLDKGGLIMYILVFLSIIGISIIIWKLFIFRAAFKNIEDISKKIADKLQLKNNETIEEVSLYVLKLEKGMETVKTIATIAPLLGLLGTVIGILDSFEKIASKGMSTSFFASGISLALITTIGGLVVAIPNTIGYNYLIKYLDAFEIKLNKEIKENLKDEKQTKS